MKEFVSTMTKNSRNSRITLTDISQKCLHIVCFTSMKRGYKKVYMYLFIMKKRKKRYTRN